MWVGMWQLFLKVNRNVGCEWKRVNNLTASQERGREKNQGE